MADRGRNETQPARVSSGDRSGVLADLMLDEALALVGFARRVLVVLFIPAISGLYLLNALDRLGPSIAMGCAAAAALALCMGLAAISAVLEEARADREHGWRAELREKARWYREEANQAPTSSFREATLAIMHVLAIQGVRILMLIMVVKALVGVMSMATLAGGLLLGQWPGDLARTAASFSIWSINSIWFAVWLAVLCVGAPRVLEALILRFAGQVSREPPMSRPHD